MDRPHAVELETVPPEPKHGPGIRTRKRVTAQSIRSQSTVQQPWVGAVAQPFEGFPGLGCRGQLAAHDGRPVGGVEGLDQIRTPAGSYPTDLQIS